MNNNIHHHIYKREISTMHVIKKNGHKTGVQKDNVTTRKEKKSTYILTTSLKKKKNSPYQKCPMLTLPLNT